MSGKVKSWLDEREWLFKWTARLSQLLLLPLLAVGMRWGKLELETYGRENFASTTEILLVKKDIAAINDKLESVKALQRDNLTRKEHEEAARETNRQQSLALNKIVSLEVKVDVMNETMKEMRADVRELRKMGSKNAANDNGPIPFQPKRSFAGR